MRKSDVIESDDKEAGKRTRQEQAASSRLETRVLPPSPTCKRVSARVRTFCKRADWRIARFIIIATPRHLIAVAAAVVAAAAAAPTIHIDGKFKCGAGLDDGGLYDRFPPTRTRACATRTCQSDVVKFSTGYLRRRRWREGGGEQMSGGVGCGGRPTFHDYSPRV